MRAIKSRRLPPSSIASEVCASRDTVRLMQPLAGTRCDEARGACHLPGGPAAGLPLRGGLGLLQRGGTLDLMQDVLCLAVELIAGMAAHALGRGFHHLNRVFPISHE